MKRHPPEEHDEEPPLFRGLGTSLELARMARRTDSAAIAGPSSLGWVHFEATRAGLQDYAELFVYGLETGKDLGDGNPILLLRNRLIAVRDRSSRWMRFQCLCLMVRAWNARLAGESLGVLKITSDKDGNVQLPELAVSLPNKKSGSAKKPLSYEEP